MLRFFFHVAAANRVKRTHARWFLYLPGPWHVFPLFFCKNVAFQSGHTGGGHLIGVALDIIDNPPTPTPSLRPPWCTAAERRGGCPVLSWCFTWPAEAGCRGAGVHAGGWSTTGEGRGVEEEKHQLLYSLILPTSAKAAEPRIARSRQNEEGKKGGSRSQAERRGEREGKLRADVPICQVNGWPDASSN